VFGQLHANTKRYQSGMQRSRAATLPRNTLSAPSVRIGTILKKEIRFPMINLKKLIDGMLTYKNLIRKKKLSTQRLDFKMSHSFGQTELKERK
jgi:hypothetical protein